MIEQKFMIKNAISDGKIENKWEEVFIPLYGKGWRSPQSISLKSLLNQLGHTPEKVSEAIENIPEPPNGAIMKESFIAIDENYLYVWIGDKWKRTILSEW